MAVWRLIVDWWGALVARTLEDATSGGSLMKTVNAVPMGDSMQTWQCSRCSSRDLRLA
jgi:hypothetical protein